MSTERTLYCTTVRFVDLVWADSEAGAVQALRQRMMVGRADAEFLDGEAFVSEPVEAHGWEGSL